MRALVNAAGDDDTPIAMRAAAEWRRQAERLQAQLVRHARNARLFWADIARELGVSKQAVHRKHGRRRRLGSGEPCPAWARGFRRAWGSRRPWGARPRVHSRATHAAVPHRQRAETASIGLSDRAESRGTELGRFQCPDSVCASTA